MVQGSSAIGGVSFDADSHSAMQDMHLSKQSVKLSPVTVKRQRDSSGYEVIVNKKSKLSESSNKIEDLVPEMDNSLFTKIKDVRKAAGPNLENLFTIKIKVVQLYGVQEIEKDGKLLKKRDVLIADDSGVINLLLWQNSIDHLQVGHSYNLINVKAKEYIDDVYITLTNSSVVHIIDNIGDVSTQPTPGTIATTTITGEIVGCNNVESFRSCLFCKGKLYQPRSEVTTCTSCSAAVRVSKCPNDFSCSILVQDAKASTSVELTAFAKHLLPLLSSRDFSPELISKELAANKTVVKIDYDNSIVNHLEIL